MMWPSKTLAFVVLVLQVAQSPSCTFNHICRWMSSYSGVVYHNSSSTSLYDCLKTCYSIKNCTYAAFDSVRSSIVFY
ncbi:hypothetical protein V3C99_005083, partial [Haemonchus contortus]|uniref:Apple domain-containing protein n=1 Tax=Haemonchus contortus TaxID=6289 RepID=A0A7I4XTW6_HAECO